MITLALHNTIILIITHLPTLNQHRYLSPVRGLADSYPDSNPANSNTAMYVPTAVGGAQATTSPDRSWLAPSDRDTKDKESSRDNRDKIGSKKVVEATREESDWAVLERGPLIGILQVGLVKGSILLRGALDSSGVL